MPKLTVLIPSLPRLLRGPRPGRLLCHRRTRRSSHGFTLIELLVVIAVIAILAAILFPTFAKARESARRTACLSNLHQLNLAVQQYTQDYDEMLPGATDGPNGIGLGGGWVFYDRFGANRTPRSYDPARGSIMPYIKSVQVFVCPSDAQGRDSGDSYALNSCLVRRTNTGYNAGQTLAAFGAPASWMLLGEEASWSGEDQAINTDGDSTDDGYFNVEFGNLFSTRHFGGSNLAFLDGHCKSYKTSQILANGFLTGGTVNNLCPQ